MQELSELARRAAFLVQNTRFCVVVVLLMIRVKGAAEND